MSKTDLRIPTLTDEHQATFEEWTDRWTAIGRNTERMDRDAAARHMVAAYTAASLPAPRVFYGLSPVGGAIMRSVIVAGVGDGVRDGVRAGVGDGVRDGVRAGVRDGVGDGVRAGVGDGVRDGVWTGVRDGVGAGVRDGVRDGVWDGVWTGVRDGVRDGVGAGVWTGVRAGVRDGERAGVRAGVGAGVRAGVGAGWHEDIFFGCHEAGWLSYYDWFAAHGLSDVCAPLAGLIGVAQTAGWCWLHRGFVVITDRPVTLHDERVAGTLHRRRLHNPTGPSVTYADGWSTWHWHGQLVPQWVIETPTVEQINVETNTEIRRCAIERYGWDRYLTDLGVTPVHTEPDPGNSGHLLSLYDIPTSAQVYRTPVRLLVMRNASLDRDGTRRTFAETVPAGIDTAGAAAAWQFGETPDTYRQLLRAT